MNNLYTTMVSLCLTLSALAQTGQLPNVGFENWTDQNLYNYPTDWNNSNVDNFQGVATVFQSTDAQDGTYSCEITAEAAGQDTIFGYVMHGQVGPMGPSNGIAYNTNFDEMQYQYKCDLAAGDTLFVIATRFIAGVPVSTQIIEAATGTESSWTSGAISFANGAQDELFIGFVMGNPFGTGLPSPGSWARVDNVTMHNAGIAVTNVPDPSFENWSAETTETPDDWHTLNPLLSSFNAENAVKTTDAYAGTYAIEMTTVQPFGVDTIPSFLSLGAIDLAASQPFLPVPYTDIVDTLRGVYKYAPSNNDQAALFVTFYEGATVVGFSQMVFTPSANWTSFEFPLNFVDTTIFTPDHMAMVFVSGDNPGSVLHLDDLVIDDLNLNELSVLGVELYPNPAHSSLTIKADGDYNYEIVNLSGKVVMTGQDLNGATELDISSLASGAYFVQISNEYKTESHKLIIE